LIRERSAICAFTVLESWHQDHGVIWQVNGSFISCYLSIQQGSIKVFFQVLARLNEDRELAILFMHVDGGACESVVSWSEW